MKLLLNYALVLLGPAAAGCSTVVLSGFDNPSTAFRPKFRYWLPDASVPHQSVVDDVNHMASIGAGGLELVPFYNYGLGPALSDWSVYGFGTPAFVDLFAAALNASAARGLEFDFAWGPNQGAGVPSVVETEGLAKELVYGNTTVQSGRTYTGPVPTPNVEYNKLTGFQNTPGAWGGNEIVAVVAGKVVSEEHLQQQFYLSVLDEESLVDLTQLTNQDGNLSWTAPQGNGTWVLFGIYERYTNQRSCVSVENATTALGNGSWMVDHWSSAGASKMTDFWDEQILSDDKVASLVSSAAEYAWEDSMEMQAALPWTPKLLSRFESLHGYSIVKYLPILFHATNAWGGYLPPYNITYTLGEYTTDGGPYIQDYQAALSLGYVDYLDHYAKWASSRGLAMSNQPAYNMPVDMTQAIPHVEVPELESLGFSESINQYRQFTGAAHLAGRNLISTEVGAVLGGSYKQTVPELKALFDGSFAAGVSIMTVHGYPYTGEYVGTTWPGYTPFQYEYSEMWSPQQPAWRHLDDLMAYAGRNAMVLQSGVPRVDVAFYFFSTPYRPGSDEYPTEDMNKHGYTFEYLGPENLASDRAVVSDGILAPEGPAYKALILYNQTQITPAASAALIDFAQNGLPIYIVGTMPNKTAGAKGQHDVSENVAQLFQYENVVRITSTDDFSAATLMSARVTPRLKLNQDTSGGNLNTFWTSDVDSDIEYAFLYNTGNESTFDMSFSVPETSKPFVLDAWSGHRIPMTTSTGITTSISLRANQTTILAFLPGEDLGAETYMEKRSKNIETTSATTTTALGPWELTVEAYGPSSSSSNETTVHGDITTIHVGKLDALNPWTDIPGIEHVSGVGTYMTNFSIPSSSSSSSSIVLSFGDSPLSHTLRAWVNGRQLRPIDPTNPTVDISDFVVSSAVETGNGDGEKNNTLRVEVATTLFNTVKSHIDEVYSIGYGPQTKGYYTDEEWQKYGLVGPVELRIHG